MLTPQEVSTHAFSKAVMGGYNMAMVDEFLDELTDDYTTLYKENAALKAKMKVLVEKVEDYRATEDSMRATLLTAQKMADSIVREAEQKRDQMLAQAEADAHEKVGQLQQELEEAKARLRQGQQELAKFIASSRDICSQELRYLEQLPQLPVDVPPVRHRRRPPPLRSRKRCWPPLPRRRRSRQPRKNLRQPRRTPIPRVTPSRPRRLPRWTSPPAALIWTT